jgi:hypothetical protein
VPIGAKNLEEVAFLDRAVIAVEFELVDIEIGSQLPESVI